MHDPDPATPQDLTEPAADPFVGQSVGAFRIERSIGGEVGWAAVHPLLGRKVAIRPLVPSLAQDLSQVDRLERDLKALSAIKHFGLGETLGLERLPDGRACVVTEWAEGESLEAWVDREGPPTLIRALELVDELLSGLAAAHRLGVFHLDLKLGRLFLAISTCGDSSLKVFGFGLAASSTQPTALTDLRAVGEVLFALTARFGEVPESLDAMIRSLREGQVRSADAAKVTITQILRELNEQATRTVDLPVPSAPSGDTAVAAATGLQPQPASTTVVTRDPRLRPMGARVLFLGLFVAMAALAAWWATSSTAPSAEHTPEVTTDPARAELLVAPPPESAPTTIAAPPPVIDAPPPTIAAPPPVIAAPPPVIAAPPPVIAAPPPVIAAPPPTIAAAAPTVATPSPKPARPRAASVVEPALRWLRLGSGCQADPAWRTAAMAALRDLSAPASASSTRWAEYQRREPTLTRAILAADGSVACGQTSRQLGELIDVVLRP